jgi:hypothetical protein
MSPSLSRPPAGRRLSGHASLVASLIPGAAFAGALVALPSAGAFARVRVQATWELFAIGVLGAAATIAGVADWRFHRRGGTAIGSRERRCELAALALGGLPLFGLMTAASALADPRPLLLPILAVLMVTVVLICYDELLFHRRRCSRYETALHRVLVLGHAGALLAWVHLCFVRGGGA